MKNFEFTDKFADRHIGPGHDEIDEMLHTVGTGSLEALVEETVPSSIRLEGGLKLEEPLSEYQFLKELREIAKKNKVFKSYIGMGYYNTILPAVIQRNILENPGWYTQYTPYQAEISQGRLEALLNFQTMIVDLTGMEIANASLLDEATSAAEAMIMLFHARKNKTADTFFVSEECFPQTIDVLKTRSNPLGIKLLIGDHKTVELNDNIFAMLLQYPAGCGEIYDYSSLIGKAKEHKIYTAVAADLLSLAILTPPGEFGADVVVGSTQRFGVPMGFGGPHAAYFAVKDEFKRSMPGRIIGISIDAQGNKAYRMALQTREQHIRREKATSNICTSQVLLAIMAGMYAVYHGPKGIKAIAERINGLTSALDKGLRDLGYKQMNSGYFDTLKIGVEKKKQTEIKKLALKAEINFNYIGKDAIGISLDEATEAEDVKKILEIFAKASGKADMPSLDGQEYNSIPQALKRTSPYLLERVFNVYHAEHEMLRYIKALEKKDLSLTTSMIPLGSCTMKLNAASEMLGITWPEFALIHPFVPEDQAEGYHIIIRDLEKALAEITGFAAVSLQPNSGAQGEYSGLMVIRQYHINNGQSHRNVVVIPSSAHGTNPASAVMAGMKVVVTMCNDKGNIDLEDLRKKVEENKDNLAALMVTYPSTHGVFEEDIKALCDLVHQYGGLVYMDGANMNAQVGLTSPKNIGADICHLNLHKTFAIPHGGGGPGVGPIAASEKLAAFLPGHAVVDLGREKAIHAVAAAPWGSANVLIISYAYIRMMGAEGLRKATEAAILNANYIKSRLEPYFKVLYTGNNGRVAHELIFDMHQFKASAGVEVEDIAKRLMDYGFHAPTVSFPVHDTLMVEPTESESKAELDRFCEALISIRNEIKEIELGQADRADNLLKNAPHTAKAVTSDEWKHAYSREKAAFPTEWTLANKFWPGVGRINNAYGDRNLVCTCEPLSAYVEEPAS
ncbi:MAG: aminomethyl-transferring glycine dehydrogenase [Bacteroidota bacterium]|jgi:glycine dehydrogenase|nr:aminomethyl-transferring glycine dehydrogenase [Ignavibacteria bacterium]MCU7513013.1 aminomethyl-transferring glycine dehydrogenase [Ignavibacteria bacterium]MCU7524707.1 aminomethyl-transferring glycine dehydrogenase [Ignavibacteria bacterium]